MSHVFNSFVLGRPAALVDVTGNGQFDTTVPFEGRRLVDQTSSAQCAGIARLSDGRLAAVFVRLCDVHGVDHLTPVGATPLMLAARAGNLPLVQALHAKGADPDCRDEFGHTDWLQAVSRTMEESGFAVSGLPKL